MARSFGVLRSLVGTVVARMDGIADRDADPAALTGRAGHRWRGLPMAVADHPEPDISAGESAGGRIPEEALQALDELRADQHRRMRGRWRGDQVQG